MYAIYANIGGIFMGSMLPYIAYMAPVGSMGLQINPIMNSHHGATMVEAVQIDQLWITQAFVKGAYF